MCVAAWYSALPTSRGHFSPHNSRKTLIARPLGRGMGVFREFEMWPKFYIQSCCAVCNIVLYCTVIYRESIVLVTPSASVAASPDTFVTKCCYPSLAAKSKSRNLNLWLQVSLLMGRKVDNWDKTPLCRKLSFTMLSRLTAVTTFDGRNGWMDGPKLDQPALLSGMCVCVYHM